MNFTGYLRSLEQRDGDPDPAEFELLWQNLRGALLQELQKRGLWTLPPVCLGVVGAPFWWSVLGGGREDPRDALDELVADCYSYIFVQRQRALRSHLRRRKNLDGMVFLAIRNFVHELQKANDPEGYRLFDLVRQAVEDMVVAERLFLLDDPPIRNETRLGFSPAGAEQPILADPGWLRARIERWNDDWLVEILSARYQRKKAVIAALQERLNALEAEIAAFRFRDVLDPLKQDLRRRWRALARTFEAEITLEVGEDGWEKVMRREPGQDFEDRQRFETLVVNVERSIANEEIDPARRHELRMLWRGLTRHAQDEDLSGQGRSSAVRSDEKPPSQRQLAKALGLPRERLPELLSNLRDRVARVRSATSGQLPVTRATKQAEGGEGATSRAMEKER